MRTNTTGEMGDYAALSIEDQIQGTILDLTDEERDLLEPNPPADRETLLAAVRKARELKPDRRVQKVEMGQDGRPIVTMDPVTEGDRASELLKAYRARLEKLARSKAEKAAKRAAAKRRTEQGRKRAKAARRARRAGR